MELSVYHTGLLITTGINILMGLSVYVMLSTGQLSIGSAGFMAIGAYTASVLTMVLKWDLNLALVAGGGLAAIVGLIIAFPALRLSMFYLAMATLGFSEIVRVFFVNFKNTGGPLGYGGMTGTTLLMTTIWVVLFLLAFWRIYASRLGRAFHALAQDQVAAEAMGLNPTLLKVTAFVISGFSAGIAGGLFAHDAMFISPAYFTIMPAFFAVLAVILGGRATVWGVVVGTFIFSFLPELLRFLGDWRMAAYGAVFVVVLIFRPNGLITAHTLDFRGRWNRRKSAIAAQRALADADLEKVM
ncbi:MAG: branched-chain amino acid ABC transporter permease [Chloroflexota bacterium]|nr:MAG: branched-chain amino acid ABC transporter permease [Chloroflexota bacterium]